MKKLVLLFTAVVCVGSIAHGSEFSGPSAESAPGVDKFQTILDLAKQGQPADFANAEGVYTGRCYDLVNRNIARNGVLGVMEIDSTINGPLFPKERVVSMAAYAGLPDAADSKSKEELESLLISIKHIFSNIQESPLSFSSKISSSVGQSVQIFRNQNYILSISTPDNDGKVVWAGGLKLKDVEFKAGQPWYACYFFNKK